jgi:ABC-type multidrug transport system fused ATPase/permease subunit
LFTYFRAGGGWFIWSGLLALLLASKGANQASNYWLSYWTHTGAGIGGLAQDWYLEIYAGFVLAVVVFTFAQASAFGLATTASSRRLHNAVFASIMRAPQAYFDTQPIGRILSRFTGDMDAVDVLLPTSMEQAAEYLTMVLLSIVVIAAVFPYFLLPLVPIASIFLFITQFFRKGSRELKRLDSIARSPLVTHMQATLQGLVTIRAFGQAPRFTSTNEIVVNHSTQSWWAFYVVNRWVAIRLDYMTAMISTISVIFCVAEYGNISPGLAGLVIVSALQTGGIMQFAVRQVSEVESYLTSVERLEQYATQIPHEPVTSGPPLADEEAVAAIKQTTTTVQGENGATKEQVTVSTTTEGVALAFPERTVNAALSSVTVRRRAEFKHEKAFDAWYPDTWNRALVAAAWPRRGVLQFEDVCLRYRPGLPLVLQGVSFTVAAGHRMGVVGRTGAGKTSLTLALYRLMEVSSGRILLDGVDISRINVYHLRSRLAIIPQTPTLYSGTVRSNLDPFGQVSDEALLAALSSAGLAEFVNGHPLGLGREIAEGGANVSAGEAQLLCLARALLRGITGHTRVYVMDEATASTDAATDSAIQRTIRHAPGMAGATMLVIAHRLASVMDSDRILVLDKGRVVEYDSPAALLGLAPRQEPALLSSGSDGKDGSGGFFAAMVRETGEETSQQLIGIALEAERTRQR